MTVEPSRLIRDRSTQAATLIQQMHATPTAWVPMSSANLSRTVRRALRTLACSLPVLAACDSTGPVRNEATFTGTWAGVSWAGSAHAGFYPTEQDTLWVTGMTPPGASMASSFVSFGVPYRGVGTYSVDPANSHYTYLVGGDVRVGSYAIPQGSVGEVVIEEHTATHIRGTVDMPMVHVFGEAPVGSEARFQGAFRATIVFVGQGG
jgi:hypothetical protein